MYPNVILLLKILQKKKKHRDKKRDKDKEVQASLMVACLKRLLPVGLNLFAGREQELVQHCKDRFLKVKIVVQCTVYNSYTTTKEFIVFLLLEVIVSIWSTLLFLDLSSCLFAFIF